MDMEYNLPVRVRDQLMGTDNTRGVGGVQMPSSDVNKEFYWANQRQSLEENTLQARPVATAVPHGRLVLMRRWRAAACAGLPGAAAERTGRRHRRTDLRQARQPFTQQLEPHALL